jgi:NADP-dependent 3-hydroxy acid dehydrogenase YdfG
VSGGVVWITGASSGIGEALARRLARDGRRVAVSARSATALDTLAAADPSHLMAVPLDVTDATACAAAVAEIETRFGEIDLAVLNAGTHQPMSADDFSTATLRRLLDINLLGVAHWRRGAAAMSPSWPRWRAMADCRRRPPMDRARRP